MSTVEQSWMKAGHAAEAASQAVNVSQTVCDRLPTGQLAINIQLLALNVLWINRGAQPLLLLLLLLSWHRCCYLCR